MDDANEDAPRDAEVVEPPRKPTPGQKMTVYKDKPKEEALAVQTQPGEMLPYQGAGMLDINPADAKRLMEPFDPLAYDIKPTGEVYVSQIQYRRRLNTVFGPGNWSLIPMTEPKMKVGSFSTAVFQKYHLIVYGKFAGEVWGEGAYSHKNDNATEATAIEGAKSNALMRACKDLGIASECWDRRWTEKFKAEQCVNVMAPNWKGELKSVWRLKDSKPFKGEKQG